MKLTNRNPKIILIGGKARSGKSTVSELLQKHYEKENKKVIISPYTKYLKEYIKQMTGWDKTDKDKPRELLQKLSSELIKKELNMNNFFIRRQIEDLQIYSYFADIIIIPDVRFPAEIEKIKEQFNNVLTIKVIRKNYQSDLTEEQKQDITETALDNYDNFDFMIDNNETENLETKVLEIIRKTKKGTEK